MTDTSSNPKRLLIVEDEKHLAAGLKLNFELEGYEVDTASAAREAVRHLATSKRYDVILLDVMLPDISGIELCQRIRSSGNHTPILMLTAKGAIDDRIQGLEAGADDYMLKPFDLSELIVRVKSLIRRQRWDRTLTAPSTNDQLRFGRAVIDFNAHCAHIAGVELKLTTLEFDLLRYFASHAGRALSRDELLEEVWGWAPSKQTETRTVDNFIVRLRKHFEINPSSPIHFISVRGVGYRFDPGPI